jgi:hypothetical protein
MNPTNTTMDTNTTMNTTMDSMNMNKDIKEDNKKKKQECSVCCSQKVRIINCPYCEYISCNDCNEKYILDSINKPHCMACKKEFSNSFFYENFSKAFINKRYKNHREKILFEKEKYLLPATQPEVEKIFKKEKMYEEISNIKKLINELKEQEDRIRNNIHILDIGGVIDGMDEKDEEKKEVYICPCPKNDCRGFLSLRYKCGICGINACPECREIKEEDHKCDPNIVESVKEIKKTTRNCPNCKSLIFKISGCDQMFCTLCHIAFCWKTGKIEKGHIHNPHYFEYLRTNGEIPRNPNEERCGGLPNIMFLTDKHFRVAINPPIQRFSTVYGTIDFLISSIYRQVRHIREVEIRNLPTQLDNQSNMDLRIEFLLKNINEDEFKSKLQRREKERNKKLEYREVLDMYINVMQDLFYELERTKDYVKFLKEEKKVRLFVENGILLINSKYNSNLRLISSMFI